MYNCYVSSSISVRCKGSFSYSYIDDHNCDNRGLVASSHCCCACCGASLCRVPLRCDFVCGQRQSSLIQFTPSRRLVLGGLNAGFSRLSVCDFSGNGGFSRVSVGGVHRSSGYCKSYGFEERGFVGRRGNVGKGRYGCNADDAEVIIDLLTEEVGEECLGVRKRNVRRVQLEESRERERESSDSFVKKRMKDVKLVGRKGAMKREMEILKLKLREEDEREKEDRRREKREYFSRGESRSRLRSESDVREKENRRQEMRESVSRGEIRSRLSSESDARLIEDRRQEKKETFFKGESRSRLRSESSGGTSYYSVSDSGEFEDDRKVQAKHVGFVGESSTGQGRDHRESRYNREVTGEIYGSRGYNEEHEVLPDKGYGSNSLYTEAGGVDYNLRKKSEKKLDEELTEQTESRNNSRLSDFHESGYGKSFNVLKQHDDIKETSSSVENIDARRQQYRHTDQQVGGLSQSRVKYKQFSEIPDIHDTAVESASGSQIQYSGRKEGLHGSSSFVRNTAREQIIDSVVTREEQYGRNYQTLDKSSKSQEINREALISHRQSETKMKNLEDDATLVPRLNDSLIKQHGEAGQQVTTQTGTSGETQRWAGISNTQNINIPNTYISQKKSDSRTRIEISESAGTSYPEATRRTGSMKEPQVTPSQTNVKVDSSSERRTGSHESYTTAVNEKSKHNVTDESVMRRGPPSETQRPTKMTSSHDNMSTEAFSSSSSFKFGSQVGLDPSYNTSSSATARARLRDELTGWHGIDDSPSENFGSGSSTLYVPALDDSNMQHKDYGEARSGTQNNMVKFLSNDDVIGSASRLQRSSTEFVDEFVDELRHEVSTSEVQKERTKQTKLVPESVSSEQKGPGLYGSGDSEQNDPDPMHLSEGSGAKGPSDEMWDVTGPSIQESSQTEDVPEATTTTGNTGIKRNDRSMWNMISDIVRMRWASNSETNKTRSGGKSSSDQSTSTEAWYSGHDPDESNDENIKQGRETILQESSSVDQEGLGEPNAHDQEELNGSKRSKDKMKRAESGLPFSSLGGSVSPKGNSSLVEETVGKRSEGTSGILKPELAPTMPSISMKTSPPIVHEISEQESLLPLHARSMRRYPPIAQEVSEPESSLPLPAMRMKRSTPIVQEISESGEVYASGSGTVAPSGQPSPTNVTETLISEGKTRETKQKKFLRTKQVLRDRSTPIVHEISSAGEAYASGSGTVALSGQPGPTKATETLITGEMKQNNFLRTKQVLGDRSNPIVQEIAEAGEDNAAGGGPMALSGQPGSADVTEISISEGKTREMKQRKFQRTKQVLRDRFDEWEEAYIFETEQRKNDEKFMREALIEAKKAADVWEVPVGAVLVQHGKIIARGYNLVEELRDSTAHAEMICIREASNILRSWRLSDTTLYVTLEPCAMCAGAILQARIDTIVWGAPNKLLGADGSWIRLFPIGDEGHSGSETTDKAAAPVHPFHPNIKLRRGVLAAECSDIMQQFFQLRRKKKDKQQDKKPDPPTETPPPSCLPISTRPSKLLTKMHDAFHILFCL